METENTKREQMELARIRFGVIAPMVQGTFQDESMSAYCHRVSAIPVKLPDGRQVTAFVMPACSFHIQTGGIQ